jgi:transcriptional regulator with XRE-family HTH domain
LPPWGFDAAISLAAKIQIYPSNDSDWPVRPSPTVYFDFEDLYNALDNRRTSKGKSWEDVAVETGVAAATLKRTRQGGKMETDGILAMVRWLGETPEGYIPEDVRAPGFKPADLKPVSPGKHSRFNTKALYRAIDDLRLSRRMNWSDVAAEIGHGVTPSMLTHLRAGGRIEVTFMVRAVRWLDRSVESFTHETER